MQNRTSRSFCSVSSAFFSSSFRNFIRNFSVRFYMLGYEWTVALSTHISIGKTLFQVLRAPVAVSKVHTTSFFKCPNYLLFRKRYLPNNLNELNINDLLYGLSNASETENEILFAQVQDFILHSKRFVKESVNCSQWHH